MSKKLKILIVGSGGREHAIGWKVAQSPRAGEIFFAPGNGGTVGIGTNVDIKATDVNKLLDFAKREHIDLTLALPDDPLALGIVDIFGREGLRIWGPTQQASELEWSKAFAKDFMRKYNLPTAEFETFTDYDKAQRYLLRQKYPIVIKADGLAFGKGVLICKNKEEAEQALSDILVKKIFGDSGNRVVIEEFMNGIEISVHALSDGENYIIFPLAQDHKRIGENNTGPNTGGMGVIAPLSFINPDIIKQIEKEIIAPALESMSSLGAPFKGILYPSIMLTIDGPKIIEFNARFGDPEAQVYMRLLDGDLLEILEACVEGKLNTLEIKWKNLFACNIALASLGYPEKYEKGKEIFGVEGNDKDVVIFHAGTKIKDNKLVTNGGRVLGVSAVGENLEQALKTAYDAIKKINFEGMQYRKDIGKEALEISK
jgi:phosphoribosylamine--glycine ligase